MARSISATTSGGAEEPAGLFTLKPLSVPGLWLAVITIAPAAWRSMTAYEITGVGWKRSDSSTRWPLPASTSATARAKRSEPKRVS